MVGRCCQRTKGYDGGRPKEFGLSRGTGGLPKANAGKPAGWPGLLPDMGRAIHVAAAEDGRTPTRFARTRAGQRQVRWLKEPTLLGSICARGRAHFGDWTTCTEEVALVLALAIFTVDWASGLD